MGLEIRGQDAIDAARKALREGQKISIFGNTYAVVGVSVTESAHSDVPKGDVELLCMSQRITRLGGRAE